MLVYRKGLYLVGRSHHHAELRTLGLDKLTTVEWIRGERFEYPPDYHPSQLVEGAFGLIDGPLSEVRVRFDREVVHLTRRRRWHPSQRIRNVKGGIEMYLHVHASVELERWILGYANHAEVLKPKWLRRRLRGRLARAARRYRED